MENLIEKITIESLFEGDSEILYVELRARAETANMPMPEFHTGFFSALKNGFIEADELGNVKLMSDSELPKKRYKTEIMEGVKPANRLCIAVKRNMLEIFEQQKEANHDIEDWAKALNDCIAYHALHFPRCGKPTVIRWHNQKVTQLD